MARLLLIETSTSLCSVALAEDERIVCSRRSTEPRAHASLTAVFVKEILEESGWNVPNLDAVAVSAGPGSYTGLRVGSSTAKGLCFGGQLPLIAVSTLDILARQAIEAGLPEGCKAIIPMVDARRMEVYTAVYSPEGIRQTDISPVILDENSFADLFASGPVAVIGDAAEKFAPLRATADGRWRACPPPDSSPQKSRAFRGPRRGRGRGPSEMGGAVVSAANEVPPEAGCGCANGSVFMQCCPEASAMLVPAMRKYEKKEFEDIAYFEPFYLKQFIATTPKKLF